jgi:PAS domain S-box-containing protein
MQKTKANVIKNVTLSSEAEVQIIKKQTISAFLDLATNGYYILNRKGFIREVNKAGAMSMGLEKSDLINMMFEKFIFAEDHEIFNECMVNLVIKRKLEVCEARLIGYENQRRWFRFEFFAYEHDDLDDILLVLTDITKQKNINDIQSFLLGNSWSESGRDFFEALAGYMAKILNVDYVCIDRLEESGHVAHTVAVYFDGNYEDNVSYTLEDTPCGKVVGQTVCCYPSNVRHLFPKDLVLQDMVAESYAGTTLWGTTGKPIGLIAVISRKPLADPGLTESMLNQVSIRAASELEHRQLEDNIIRSHKELERLVKKRTAELQKANTALKNEIQKRKLKEKSLLIAEEKYRTVADFTYDWETWVGPDGQFIYVSPSCQPTTGYSVEEFMNDPSLVIKITHPDDREMVENHYNEKRKRNLPSCSLDFRIITRSGEERWIGHSCQPVQNAEGKWIGQRGSNRDITDRKKTENTLLASQIHLRALTQRMDVTAEEERTRIAREIHDELGHILTILKFDIEGLASNQDISMDLVKSELNNANSMIDSLIDTVRTIASSLRPGILDHLGLIPAIEWQIEQFQKRTNIFCECDIQVINEPFNSNETTGIFRILQEILTNVIRHSKAEKVSVSLNKKDNKIVLMVRDNGIGFELNSNNHADSLGLMGMRERALSIGGQIEIESEKYKGTRVTLLLKRN